ncbi:hypothetical protein B5M09_002291 [Aphanomyces astaci]|nr:hypothetical protein B5M09_002291 [Aphanomyces astaci]
MAGGDSRCKTKRRTDRAFRDVEVKHRELKDDLNRLQLSLDQVRGQAMVHRPSLQDIYLRQHIEAVNQ